MNILQTYLQDISKYPQLSPQEELTLANLARQGDAEAREQLIHAHLPLVVRVAKVYMPPCDEIMDLIQEGNIGLIYAVDKFDSTRGTKFSTYAFFWINKHIQRFLNHEPDALVSLDTELTDSSEYLLLSDTIADRPSLLGSQTIQHINAKIEHEELQRQVRQMLSRLPEREQEVLKLLYGLDNYPILSRNEVAQIIGVTPQFISRIRIDSLRQLEKAAVTMVDEWL